MDVERAKGQQQQKKKPRGIIEKVMTGAKGGESSNDQPPPPLLFMISYWKLANWLTTKCSGEYSLFLYTRARSPLLTTSTHRPLVDSLFTSSSYPPFHFGIYTHASSSKASAVPCAHTHTHTISNRGRKLLEFICYLFNYLIC